MWSSYPVLPIAPPYWGPWLVPRAQGVGLEARLCAAHAELLHRLGSGHPGVELYAAWLEIACIANHSGGASLPALSRAESILRRAKHASAHKSLALNLAAQGVTLLRSDRPESATGRLAEALVLMRATAESAHPVDVEYVVGRLANAKLRMDAPMAALDVLDVHHRWARNWNDAHCFEREDGLWHLSIRIRVLQALELQPAALAAHRVSGSNHLCSQHVWQNFKSRLKIARECSSSGDAAGYARALRRCLDDIVGCRTMPAWGLKHMHTLLEATAQQHLREAAQTCAAQA